jgi:hypothetical protein
LLPDGRRRRRGGVLWDRERRRNGVRVRQRQDTLILQARIELPAPGHTCKQHETCGDEADPGERQTCRPAAVNRAFA